MNKVEILQMVDKDLDKAVKIQGTMYDRKRKYGKAALAKMTKLQKKNKTFKEIAKALGCAERTVQYNLDAEFRKEYNANRSGAHTGKDRVTKANRIAYKRQLVAAGKVTA